MPESCSFPLFDTYFHVDGDGEALPIEVTPEFWQELMGGDTSSEGVARIHEGGGWLVTSFRKTAGDADHSEMHPAGDELLVLLSGAMDVVLGEGDDERVVRLQPGTVCVVPRGTWHHAVVHEPSELLGLTWGEGTQVRPR